jgi:hypothetical protein
MYEGVYLPYPQRSPIPQSELVIAEKKMNLAQEQLEVEGAARLSSGSRCLSTRWIRSHSRQILRTGEGTHGGTAKSQ